MNIPPPFYKNTEDQPQFYPNPEDIPSEMYSKELWFPLTDAEVPGIIPGRYMVSSFGYVYDKERNFFYPSRNVTKENYVFSDIRLVDGTKIHISNHILVRRKFSPFRPADSTEIDHVNGHKYQNWVWNLEYVTHKENLDRAVKTGLYPVGENQQNAIYTNDQIREICKLIQAGYTPDDIVKMLQPQMPGLRRYIVNDIKAGRQWASVSKEFDFSNMYQKQVSRPFTEDQVRLMCSGIEKFGYTKSPREIAYAIGIDMNSLSEFEQNRYINCISRLRRKLIFKDICAEYNF